MNLLGSLLLLLMTEPMLATSSVAKAGRGHRRCRGLSPDEVAATVRLVGTVQPMHLRLTFQGQAEECLVEALWAVDVAAQLVTAAHLWEALKEASYAQPWQHLLVGNLPWITSTLSKVKSLYQSARLNAMKTHWFLLLTETDFEVQHPNLSSDARPTSGDSRLLQPLQPSSNFRRAMAQVEGVLFEGMRGILISSSRRGPDPSVPSQAVDKRVLVAGVDAPGDGSWRLKLAAAWATGGLQVFRPLWPSPSFNLQGRTLRINCLKKPTVFLFNDGDDLSEARGYAADMVRLIQRRLNFTDVLVPNTGFGAYRNGSWNGMVGDLLRGKADVSPLDFTPIWQRTLVIDFGLIYSTDNVVIISKAPGVFIKPLLLLEIFTPLVWACLVMVGVAAGAMVGGLMWARAGLSEGQEQSRGLVTYCMATLKIIVFQSSVVWPRWLGGRLVGGTVMFLAVVVGSVYSGSITAYLAIPFRSEPINSVPELLRREVVPAIRRLSSPYSFFLTENSGVLGEKVRQVMVVFSGLEVSKWNFLKEVAHGTYGFIDTASSAVGRSGQFERIGKPCLFHIGRVPVRMDLDAFAYPKNSPIMHQFDEVMRWMRSYGIVEHIKGSYYKKSCSLTVDSDGPTAISLTQAQGAFYVLTVGLVTALAILVIEVIVHRIV